MRRIAADERAGSHTLNGSDVLAPLDAWHAPAPQLDQTRVCSTRRGAGWARRQALLAAGRAPAKGATLAYQKAVSATIWSFVATFVFAFIVVLPMKGWMGCLNFFTGMCSTSL